MSARGKHVGLITKANEVLVWNIGGSLISVQRPKIQESESTYWSPEAIVFHPFNERHFFIVYHDWPGTGTLLRELPLRTVSELWVMDLPPAGRPKIIRLSDYSHNYVLQDC